LTEEFVRPLYHWRTSRAHEYTHSPTNCADDDNASFNAGPGHGAPPRNVQLAADDYLLDHLDHQFALLWFTDADAMPADLLATVREARDRGVPLRVIAVGEGAPVSGADETLNDVAGHLRDRYGVLTSGAAYLLRPDHHVCARWTHLDATRLRDALVNAAGLQGA
jgi:3-(3-hydroxy-phenyl)propionate hydroxylase